MVHSARSADVVSLPDVVDVDGVIGAGEGELDVVACD